MRSTCSLQNANEMYFVLFFLTQLKIAIKVAPDYYVAYV